MHRTLLIEIPRHALPRLALGRADIARRASRMSCRAPPLQRVRHAIERALQAAAASPQQRARRRQPCAGRSATTRKRRNSAVAATPSRSRGAARIPPAQFRLAASARPSAWRTARRSLVVHRSASVMDKLSRSRGAFLRPRFVVRTNANGSRAAKNGSRQARNRFGPRKGQGWGLAFVLPLAVSPSSSQEPIKKDAERRQTLGATAASCERRALFGARTLVGVPPRLSPRELFIPKAQLQARLPGTWSERALPAFACPSPGMHLPPRS